jgi:hypothetical protein
MDAATTDGLNRGIDVLLVFVSYHALQLVHSELKVNRFQDRFIFGSVNDLHHPILPANASQFYRHNKHPALATNRRFRDIFSPEHYW